MARHRTQSRNQAASLVENERRLSRHLRLLGLASPAEYKEWCLIHGFSPKLGKGEAQLAQERQRHQELQAQACLKKSQRRKQQHACVIDRIASGDLIPEQFRGERWAAVRRILTHLKSNRRARLAFCQLLQHLPKQSALLEDRTAVASLGEQPGNTFVDGLAALALHSAGWLRPVESWTPRSHNARRQFAALARHLFAEYDVPAFLDLVWFRGTCPAAMQQQDWFIHVATGKNIRTARLPISYTKRMAHHFLQAPHDYTVEAALRWGQIHGLGGNARLAEAIWGTRLCDNFEHDSFWTTVLRFFIAHPMLDTAHVGPIVDYLHNQRFVEQLVFMEPGVIERQPPTQPNLCMKGRTVAGLLEQVRRWHRQLPDQKTANAQWAKSGIGEFEFVEGSRESGNMRLWTIRELLSAKALTAEGKAMRHCVATYAVSCLRRTTSIWTMEMESYEGKQKLLTIEVRLGSKIICQARGKFNAPPDPKARAILNRWAAQERLTVASYV